jgi:hypothetical protein
MSGDRSPAREHDGHEVTTGDWGFSHSGPLNLTSEACEVFMADSGGPTMPEVYDGLASTNISSPVAK